MRKDLEDVIDPSQPALVVTYGNTNRRRRVLDSDLFVLGRAQCCDLSLVSPEVAPIHCVLFRSGNGWRVRDCSGRPGTRVNGKVIQEILVQDTDALQVGTFSFQLHLPPGSQGPHPVEVARQRTAPGNGPLTEELEHLRRSRRRLGELALDLRRQLQEHLAGQESAPSQAEHAASAQLLRQQAEELQKRQHDLEDRVAQLDEEEKALVESRIALDRDAASLQKMRTRNERDLTKLRKDAEAEIQARWQEFQQRCRQAEEEHQQRLKALLPTLATAAPAVVPAVAPGELDRRSQELACFARHLRRLQQRLCSQEKLQDEVTRLRQALAGTETIAPQALPVAQATPDLQPELILLEHENEQLRHDNETLRNRIEVPRPDPETKLQLVHLEGQMAALRKQAELAAAAEDDHRQRLAKVEKELQDRETLIEQLQSRLNNRGVWDTATFSALEAELIRNRRELERDRRALTEQLKQLQQRQTEMLDAARETELQMSRERAQLARERVELTRLREELRAQQQRKQPNSTVRRRLASLRTQQQADTVVDGQVESPVKARPTNQRKRTSPPST